MATKTSKKAPVQAGTIPAAITGQGNPGIAGGNLMAALAGLKATAAPSGTGSNDPNVLVDATEVGNYVQAMKDEKDAIARKATSFALLQPQIESQRVKLSRQFGRYLNSVDVNGQLKFIVPNRYLTIEAMDDKGLPSAAATGLQSAFGLSFGRYLAPGVEIKIKAKTWENLTHAQQTALAQGIEKLTKEIGVNPFDTKVTLVPTEALDVERIMDPAVEAIFQAAHDAKFIAPIKSTLKEIGK